VAVEIAGVALAIFIHWIAAAPSTQPAAAFFFI
jgi:hypothetical protein